MDDRRVDLLRECHNSVYARNVRGHTQKVFEELAALYEIWYAWGTGPSGHHAEGRALDVMSYSRGGFTLKSPGRIRKGWNQIAALYLWQHRERLGIEYVIFDQLIQSINENGYAHGGWTRYPGYSHANHVHTSFVQNPPAYRPPVELKPKEWDELASKKEIGDVVAEQIKALVPDLVRRQIGLYAGKSVWRWILGHPNGEDRAEAGTYLTHGRVDAWQGAQARKDVTALAEDFQVLAQSVEGTRNDFAALKTDTEALLRGVEEVLARTETKETP